jgi:DNA-binding XRE family transcriptional regulator/quercetin dioxygenase-like cupin family protein
VTEPADPRPPAGPRPEGRLERTIADRARELRRARGATLTEMAAKVGVSKATLSKIENAQISSSLTTLARLAVALDVPVTALFRGADTAREAVFTPAGGGARVVTHGARAGHDDTLLGGLRGGHRRMEAHVVTLREADEVFPLFQHPGTELIYVLAGVVVYGHGDARHTLGPGDALQLDGEGPHGPVELLEPPVRFLSVVALGDT